MARELAEVGDAALGYFVDQARHAEHSWSEIGEALGVSKQAAQQKHTVRLSLRLNSATFERFTPRARKVVAGAEAVARDWDHASVGTEHLLLALYRDPEGIAARILASRASIQRRRRGGRPTGTRSAGRSGDEHGACGPPPPRGPQLSGVLGP